MSEQELPRRGDALLTEDSVNEVGKYPLNAPHEKEILLVWIYIYKRAAITLYTT